MNTIRILLLLTLAGCAKPQDQSIALGYQEQGSERAYWEGVIRNDTKDLSCTTDADCEFHLVTDQNNCAYFALLNKCTQAMVAYRRM